MIPNKRGISILEIVIAAAIVGVCVVGIIKSLNVFVVFASQNTNEAQSAILLEETMEVMQYMRDKSWANNIANKSLNTNYYIMWNGSDYLATSSPQVIDNKFSRKIKFFEVRRDSGSDDIIESGGYIDHGTRKVFVEISWPDQGATKTINSEFLIHDVYQN